MSNAVTIRPAHRPSSFTPEYGAAILNHFTANGGVLAEALVSAAEAIGRDPISDATFWRWVAARPDFRADYVRAWAASCSALEQRIFNELAAVSTDMGDVQRAKLRVDTAKWILSKRAPKHYGDKLDIALTDDTQTKPDSELAADLLRAFGLTKAAPDLAKLALLMRTVGLNEPAPASPASPASPAEGQS